MPGGTYFIYAKSPRGIAGGPNFETAEAASQYLITEHSICTVPWDDAGAYLRFSVTYEAPTVADEDSLMAATEARLKQIKPLF
jgi:LL-diaminopimelate aminotransferase